MCLSPALLSNKLTGGETHECVELSMSNFQGKAMPAKGLRLKQCQDTWVAVEYLCAREGIEPQVRDEVIGGMLDSSFVAKCH